MKNHTIVLIYNSFKDPLFQNLMFEYLQTLARKKVGHFHLVTFEQPDYQLSVDEQTQVKSSLLKLGIHWYPRDFHSGRFLLAKKAWDLFTLLVSVLQIKRKYKADRIFCFANVAASMGWILSAIFKLRLMVFSYEPHSAFMADLGYWSRSGIKFKILNALEQKVGLEAETILTGTSWMRDKLIEMNSKARVYRAPTAVDPAKFFFNHQERQTLRSILGVDHEPLFVYAGKFGGLYFENEIALLFDSIKKEIPNARLLILTPQSQDHIHGFFAEYAWVNSVIITRANGFKEMRGYLSASDFGICLIPPTPAQKYRSPTKVAEYLMCGLPYITMAGISEDDVYATAYDIGVVIRDITHFEQTTIEKIQALLNEDKDELRQRCRNVGLEYRSKSRIDEILLTEFK